MTVRRMRRARAGLLVCLAALLAGCAGSLSHIETQRRMEATYAGFPPVFAEADLNRWRSVYVTEKAAYDADPQGFLGSSAPGQTCELSRETVAELASSSFRMPIHERTPDWTDYMAKHGQGYAEPVYDSIALKVIDGTCAGGALTGDATILMSYIRVAQKRVGHQLQPVYSVDEATVREKCSYLASRREGTCIRYSRLKRWEGQFEGGKLVPSAWVFHRRAPDLVDEPRESDYVEITTVFDYGRYEGGREAGPGVAFETTPHDRDKVHVLQNYTLTRLPLMDGRVAYTKYYGGHRQLSYALRQGVPHGELVWHEPNSSGDQRQCFIDGELVLTRDCKV